jgi:hypothetical protein
MCLLPIDDVIGHGGYGLSVLRGGDETLEGADAHVRDDERIDFNHHE